MKNHVKQLLEATASRTKESGSRILAKLMSKRGAGVLEYAVIALVGVVLGGAILVGFDSLFKTTILPRIADMITTLFTI
jgi:hypothetical protein